MYFPAGVILKTTPQPSVPYRQPGSFLRRWLFRRSYHPHLEAALALDPLSAIVHHQAGQTFRQALDYDRAITPYQEALKLNPNLYVTYDAMYWAYRRQGDFAAASKAMLGAIPF